MPWRVGRDFRHLSQATSTLLERTRDSFRPLCLIAKPLHSTRGTLWPPAVALKFSYSHAPRPDVANTDTPQKDVERRRVWKKPLQSMLRQDRSKENTAQHEPASLGPPPPEILSLLDVLFVEYPSNFVLSEMRQSKLASTLLSYLRLPQRTPALVLHLLDARLHIRALRIMHLGAEVGCTYSPKFYGQCAERLARLGCWRQVVDLTSWARQRLGYTTTWLLNWRLQALMELQHFVSTEDVLALYEKERVRASRLTYHLIISMHMRNHHLTAALDALQHMERAGFAVTARTWAVVLLGYRSFGVTPAVKSQALAALGTAADDKTSTVILNSIVRLLLDTGDMTGVAEVLSYASRPSGDPSAGPGEGSTLHGDASVGSPTTVGSPRPSRSPSPRQNPVDVTTYNLLLGHLARQGDLTRALNVLRQMQAAAVRPNSDTAAALVRLYYAAGHSNDALHVAAGVLNNFPDALEQLTLLGFSPSTAPQHPIPPSTPPTIQVLNALLSGALASHGLQALRSTLSIMEITRVDVNHTTLTLALRHIHRHGRGEYRTMVRIVRKVMSLGAAPTLQHFHVLLSSLVREDKERARPRGWRTTSPGPTPRSGPAKQQQRADCSEDINATSDEAEYFRPNAGITVPLRPRRGNLLRPILQSLIARQVRSDPVTFALRIKHDALVHRDMEAANRAFRAMVAAGLQPNRYHYGALMEGYAAAGDLRAAADVMRTAAAAGVAPDVRTHTILVAGYARRAQPAAAARAFRAMVAAGVRPDVPAIDALVSAFYRARAYRAARRVLLRLWPQIAPVPAGAAGLSLRELAVAFRALHGSADSGHHGGGGENEDEGDTPRAGHAPPKVPPRLSVVERRALRRQLHDLLRAWKSALGGASARPGGMGAGVRAQAARSRRRKTAGYDLTVSATQKPKYNSATGC